MPICFQATPKHLKGTLVINKYSANSKHKSYSSGKALGGNSLHPTFKSTLSDLSWDMDSQNNVVSKYLESKLHYIVTVLRHIGEKGRINNIKVHCM